MWDDLAWVAEEKLDGDRRIAQFCGDVVRFTGRKKSVKDGLFVEKTHNIPHLSAWGTDLDMTKRPVHIPPTELEGTVLDGEMVIPEGFITGAGGRSKHVTSIMGSLPAEAVRKQVERGWLRYAVFDCLFYKGEDIRFQTYEYRKVCAENALMQWKNSYAYLVEGVRSNKRAYLEEIYEKGGEGIVLKAMNQKYGENFGGHLKWVKVKFKANADVFIVGYKPAKEMSKKVTGEISITKYAEEGLIGAIIFGQYRDGAIWECGNTSGMDEETRRYITRNQDALLGAVFEIEHCGREPTGKFRHPQFKGWREDKDKSQCVYNPEEQ
jgi:ATP-dependent DNA ligase